MSRDQQKFQKAFITQMKANLRGNFTEASRARQLANFYRKRMDRN